MLHTRIASISIAGIYAAGVAPALSMLHTTSMQTDDAPERITVTITRSQVDALRRLARANGQSVSSIVRHAVASFLRAPAFFVPAVQSDSMHDARHELAEREPVEVA